MSGQEENIKRLYQRWYQNQATAGETEELHALIKGQNIEELLGPAMKELWEKEAEPNRILLSPEKIEWMAGAILSEYEGQHEDTTPVRRLHFFSKAWFRYAAIFVLIAGTATFLYLNNQPQQEITVKTAVKPAAILPGVGNKAILTLADGSRIELDSAANRSLAKHGITSSDAIIRYSDPSAIATTNILTTPRGGRYQLVLQDGTRVWLNSASSIKYPSVFSGTDRTVELTGEAYFEVKEASKSPFFVKLDNGATIQVLGTSFNIMAYKDEDEVQATLLEGAIKVVNENSSALLHPGEMSAITHEGGMTVKKDADIEQIIAWKNGFLVFDNAGLDVIMRRISRNYDVDVVFSGPVTTRHYTGGVRNSANIEQVLRKLELTGGVSFSIEGRKIFVKIK